ncbi:MAG: flagellar basal body P-ring formation chaperone FlgA [Desulfococcaceae bacterium]|jgi:flagella basal body P-ring formation protein FlgA|nr:flagellar basal body P-ring formation chaperone FlgA [Desulfococcaceae bacterium]
MKYTSPILFLYIFLLLTGFGTKGFSASPEPAHAVLRIAEKTFVEGEKVRLGELAEIHCDIAELRQRIENTVIGNSPLPGKSGYFRRSNIVPALHRRGIDVSRIRFVIPDTILVTRSCVIVSEKEIEEIVRNFLSGALKKKCPKAKIRSVRAEKEIVLPAGKRSHRISLPENVRLSGKVPVSVQFLVKGSPEKEIIIIAELEIRSTALITLKPLGRYKPITEKDVEIREMDADDIPSDALLSVQDVTGKRARRKIPAETVLRKDLLEQIPLIKRGDIVRLIAESDSLRITTLGQARNKGGRGDRIRVINLDSRKMIYGEVENANTVRIDF